jgi:glutathione peroxidase-family protein
LDSIYQTYSDAGIMVLGINSIDNNERDRRRMERFLQYNRISYPIIMVDYKVDSLYHVVGYPSFLMLDSEKKIIFSQAGFSKSLVNKLDSIIQEELKLPRKL